MTPETDSDTQPPPDEPPDEPPSGRPGRVCPRCGKKYEAADELRYCSACGAPIQATVRAGAVATLLADDAIISRRKLGALLKKLGCHVHEAVDGRQAVEVARAEKPDLIILDLHMPKMNGLQALQVLRAEASLKEATIVMLTAEADAKYVRDALRRGAQDYIRKDALSEELRERLSTHIQSIRLRQSE